MVRVVPLVASLVVVAACASAEVKKEEVERLSMEELARQTGQPSPPITCPGPLKVKVGATMSCSIAGDGGRHDVDVKVTSVDAGAAHFEIEIADRPRG